MKKHVCSPVAVHLVIAGLLSVASGQTHSPQSTNSAPVAADSANAAPNTNADAQPASSAEPASGDPANAEPAIQEPTGGDQSGMFVFKKDVEEVILHATVFDDQRRIVADLDRGAFSVLENGTPQTVTSFRRQDVPVAMGIVIDNSGSMRDKRDAVNHAVLNLIRACNPQDEVFVVNFGQNYYLDQDFTSDVNLLQSALHQVSAKGSTALYDAVVASAVHLENNPRFEKKILLVITDGRDNMSQETLGEALRRVQQANGLTVYAVGLMGRDPRQSPGREALQQFAQGTGGVAYFPQSLDQVEDTTRSVAHDIRSQYLIAYKPQNQNIKPDERSVRVEARASGYRNLVVSTRTGYHFPGSPAQ